jgi:DMSO reductase anchor subunit
MHPAKSVIFFTTASGAGYGLLLILLLGNVFNLLPTYIFFLLVCYGLAFILIAAGLLSSTFHLGHPERAWRALTQWRSSWLSREGVMAILTFIPTGLYALYVIFFQDSYSTLMEVIGVIGAICCVITVYCTAMIYASLKTIHAWSNKYVPYGYLLLSLTTGMVLITGIMIVWGYDTGIMGWLSPLLLLGSLFWKMSYWRFLDQTKSVSSPESATGLGEFGAVSLLEAPHTEANYLMQEMGFSIARKHSEKLRRIVLWGGFGAPFILLAFALFQAGVIGGIAAVLAVVLAGIGIFVERWLFFAEAKHTVAMYYGAKDA